jgi:hypothetical protein
MLDEDEYAALDLEHNDPEVHHAVQAAVEDLKSLVWAGAKPFRT